MPSRPRVFATRALPGEAFRTLAERVSLEVWPGPGPIPPERLRAAVGEVEGLLCLLADRIDRALLDAAPRLRVVSSFSVGVDHVDLAAASARRIPVGNTPGVLTETTADLAFALLLAAARRVAEGDRLVREGGWTAGRAFEPDLLLGRDVHGATLGVVGLGAIGQAMARRAQGFGMRVLGWSRSLRDVPGVRRVPLPELLAESDFVSLHLALSAETHGLLGARELAAAKRGTILVNTARGGLVDEPALVEALRSGRLGGAGLDVFAHEPLAKDSPLLSLPNVVVLPHIGSASLATRGRMGDLAVANLLAGLAGEPLPHQANASETNLV